MPRSEAADVLKDVCSFMQVFQSNSLQKETRPIKKWNNEIFTCTKWTVLHVTWASLKTTEILNCQINPNMTHRIESCNTCNINMYKDATIRVFIALLSMLLRGFFFLRSNSNHRMDVKRHIISSKICNAKHPWFIFS